MDIVINGQSDSKLLLDEPPLVVQRSLARLIGLNGAMVLQQIHYWCQVEGDEKDGQVYVAKSVEDINKCFDFWSEKTIRRAITDLVQKELLIKVASKSWLRTNFLRVNYSQLDAVGDQMHPVKMTECNRSELPNASGQNDQIRSGQNDQMSLKNKSSTTTTENISEKDLQYVPSKNLVTRLRMSGVNVSDDDVFWFNNYLSGLPEPPRSIPNTFKNWMMVERIKRQYQSADGVTPAKKLYELTDAAMLDLCSKLDISTHGKTIKDLVTKIREKQKNA